MLRQVAVDKGQWLRANADLLSRISRRKQRKRVSQSHYLKLARLDVDLIQQGVISDPIAVPVNRHLAWDAAKRFLKDEREGERVNGIFGEHVLALWEK